MTTTAMSRVWAMPIGAAWPDIQEAIQDDWDRGRPERVSRIDPGRRGDLPMGVIETVGGYEGLVLLTDHTGLPYGDYRSISRNSGGTYRQVYARVASGEISAVGKLRRERARAE